MKPRMQNPAMVISETMEPIQAIFKATKGGGVADETLELVHLRVSQINGCSACVDSGITTAAKSGVPDQQIHAVVAWRETPYFDDAQRSALALAEAATRLSDRPDAVSDEVWDEVAKHYDERGLAALILTIAVTNLFNRLNATTRQQAGAWG